MTISLFGPINSGAAVGADANATANANSNKLVIGKVLGISIHYDGDTPAGTTDVIVKTVGTTPEIPSQTLLTISNSSTDYFYMPRVIPHDVAGGALAALTAAEPMTIHGYVNVKIQGTDAGGNVDVWLLLEQ